jgi:hypothetical protein
MNKDNNILHIHNLLAGSVDLSYLNCLLYFILTLIYCSILIAILCYFIFGIVFLIKDYNIWKNCNGSGLWPYVLLSLVLIINKLNFTNIKNIKDNDTSLYILLGIFIELSLILWGSIEIFGKSTNCEDLYYSNLWTYSVVVFSIQIIFTIIMLLLSIIYIHCINKKISSINEKISFI